MRIGFVVPRCRPTNSHGRYVIELARRLAVSEDVTVYSGARCDSLAGRGTFRYLPILDWPMLARLATGWAASAPLGFSHFDILHTQGADSPLGNVVTAHCCTAAMHHAAEASASYRRFNHAVGARAEAYTFGKRSTRAIIAVSAKVKHEIQHHYRVNPDIVSIIRPGVDVTMFRPADTDRRAQLRAGLGLRPDDFVVLYAGGNYRLKGLLPLVEAVRRIGSPIRIVAVGVVADRELKDFLARDVETGRVIVVGPTPDIAAHYAMADCFALPTQYDTFSLVTLEAMATALPVIVSRAAGISEGLTDGTDALLLDDPGDIDGLEQRIRALAGDPVLRLRLAEGARKTAEAWSWDRVADATLRVYRSVAA
jgi:glycosyltransferase involved in cell wall biosynthesis